MAGSNRLLQIESLGFTVRVSRGDEVDSMLKVVPIQRLNQSHHLCRVTPCGIHFCMSVMPLSCGRQ